MWQTPELCKLTQYEKSRRDIELSFIRIYYKRNVQIKSQTILEEESQKKKKIPTSTLFSSNNNDEREMIQSTQLWDSKKSFTNTNKVTWGTKAYIHKLRTCRDLPHLVPKLRPLNIVHNYGRNGLLDDLLWPRLMGDFDLLRSRYLSLPPSLPFLDLQSIPLISSRPPLLDLSRSRSRSRYLFRSLSRSLSRYLSSLESPLFLLSNSSLCFFRSSASFSLASLSSSLAFSFASCQVTPTWTYFIKRKMIEQLSFSFRNTLPCARRWNLWPYHNQHAAYPWHETGLSLQHHLLQEKNHISHKGPFFSLERASIPYHFGFVESRLFSQY